MRGCGLMPAVTMGWCQRGCCHERGALRLCQLQRLIGRDSNAYGRLHRRWRCSRAISTRLNAMPSIDHNAMPASAMPPSTAHENAVFVPEKAPPLMPRMHTDAAIVDRNHIQGSTSVAAMRVFGLLEQKPSMRRWRSRFIR